MTFTTQIRQDIQRYFGSRGSTRKHRTGRVNDLTKPECLGLFFSIHSLEELNEIRKLLSMIGKSHSNVTALVFYNSYENLDVITNKSILLFNLKDFNLFGKKNEALQQNFENKQYELLISFNFDGDSFSNKLISDLNADFKIGPEHSEGTDLYDLIIKNSPDELSLIDYYKQVSHYLSVLNVNSG